MPVDERVWMRDPDEQPTEELRVDPTARARRARAEGENVRILRHYFEAERWPHRASLRGPLLFFLAMLLLTIIWQGGAEWVGAFLLLGILAASVVAWFYKQLAWTAFYDWLRRTLR